jgi:CRISPR/Cas system-associated exonuclease Cas4 (RecB family)
MALNLPKGYLSASQINLYLTCPKKYEAEYVLGVRSEVKRPAAMSVGSGVHKMVETHLQATLNDTLLTTEDITEIIEDDLRGYFDPTTVDLEGDDLGQWLDYTQKLYNVWYKDVSPHLAITATEMQVEKVIGDAPCKGFVDYIDAGAGYQEVCDLKVTKRAKSIGDARDSVQLAIYSMATDIPCVRFDSLVKTKTPKVAVARYEFAKHELDYFEELIGEVALNISRGNFPRTTPTSWACSEKWCSNWDNCRGKRTNEQI